MWQVIGQGRAVSLFQRSLEKGSLAHAYLFIGPPHVGKMTLAINLAQAVNCQTDETPCGECSSCQKIAQQKHADVKFIGLINASSKEESRGRTEIGIEQIRQVQHSASLPPFEGRCRVFIVEDAEFLSIEAANCLLKTLEEPFKKVIFILMTTNIRTIPDTVISRCQKLELVPLPADKVEQELFSRWDVEKQKAKLLARLCQGCFGWAISALRNDELLDRYFKERDNILDIINYGYEERFSYAAQLARQFSQRREITNDILNLWLDLWRDIMLVKTGFEVAIINIDAKERLSSLAEEIDLYDIRHFIENVQQAIQNLRHNANPRLVLEVLMIDIPAIKGERIGN